MGDIFETITVERVRNVANRWKITERDAYELIVNFESRQNVPILPIVVNPHFNNSDYLTCTHSVNNNVKKKSFFSFLFKCCR